MKCLPLKKPLRLVAVFAALAFCMGLFAFAAPASADEASTLASKKIIVALDPGHGGGDNGASGVDAEGTRYYEKDFTWKISSYTKEWLEAKGVNVFLTHDGTERGSNGDSTPSIYDRVERAYAAGACAVISQHINSADNETAHGFEVWVPRRCDYYPNTNTAGQKFAQDLKPKLADLGLWNRGTKTSRLEGSTYANGDTCDYYGVIRYARKEGMTGVIIEHAFISNEDDLALLKDESFLKKLGYADAEAIYENLDTFYQVYCENDEQLANSARAKKEVASAAEGSVFRLYNKWSHDHLFTLGKAETLNLADKGWTYEGVNWVTPSSGTEGVYRLYNTYTGEHLYTQSKDDAEYLGSHGWVWENGEKPVFYNADKTAPNALPVYRLYNPYEKVGTHLYTTNKDEYESLQPGWEGEGVAFYGFKPGTTPSSSPSDTVVEPEPTGTPIMGESATSREALKSWFAAAMKANGKPYNALYAEKGAPTPEDFVQILWEEATAEGVRPDVLLSQVIKETGWLQFGGLVKVEDCNFGGIGATDSAEGRNIATFPDVRCGLRAQVQHLRAYADPSVTRGNLANECVDPRFDLVSPKGKSPSVEGLSKAWASSENYGEEIVSFMNRQFPNDLA